MELYLQMHVNLSILPSYVYNHFYLLWINVLDGLPKYYSIAELTKTKKTPAGLHPLTINIIVKLTFVTIDSGGHQGTNRSP